MITAKAKLWAGIGGVVVVGALFAALTIQNARLSFAQLERDTAIEMHDRATAELQAAQAHRERTEKALAVRQAELARSQRVEQTLRAQLRGISAEVSDEKWKACRDARTPDALIDRLLAED